MKLWTLTTLCTALLLTFSGCGAKPTPKKEAVIDDTLPVVKLTKNGTIADINAIALEWEPIQDARVQGIYIYKVDIKNAKKDSNEYLETIDNRFATHYLDRNVEPESKYGYYFKTYSKKAESRKSNIVTITTKPPMESVSWIHGIENMPRSAKILWRPHPNEKVKSYIIQRKTLDEDIWRETATVQGRLSAEYIDQNLKDDFTYKYRIRVVTFDNLLSKPSKEISVVTKKLPKELQHIKATTDLPKRVELTWEKSQAKDFLLYRVYRSSRINGSYEVLTDTVKNAYVDIIEEDGKEYFYRVSVFDKDKLESIHHNNTVLGKTLVKPATPSMVEAELIDGKVVLSWNNTDPRVKGYNIQKRYKKSFIENAIEDFEDIRKDKFIDTEIEADKVYYYKVFSLDANNIKSEPSIEVEVKVPADFVASPMVHDARSFQEKAKEEKSRQKKDVIVPLQDFN